MGRDLAAAHPAAADLFRQADEILGWPLSKICWEGPEEELTKTSVCQPALYVHGLAALAVVREKLGDFSVAGTAGLSLGEFTAHSAAGTFDFATGLKLVARRGLFMEEACQATQGAMAALIGGEEEAVKALAAECSVDVANFNAPGQIVLSGTVEGIDAAVEKARRHGIRRARNASTATSLAALRVAGAPPPARPAS